MSSRAMSMKSADETYNDVSDVETSQFSDAVQALNLQDKRSQTAPEMIKKDGADSSPHQQIKIKSEVEVFFTTDKKLLDEYYNLRHSAYSDENGWSEFNDFENDFDRKGKIIVVTKNNKVVGGMRLMFSDQSEFLSNEAPGTQFTYKKLIEKYEKRDGLIFAEISAVVVADGNRDSSLTTMMFEKLFAESKSYGCHYVFGVAMALVCRNYRKEIRRFGHYVEIVINYPWKRSKTYNFDRMFPMYTKLQ